MSRGEARRLLPRLIVSIFLCAGCSAATPAKTDPAMVVTPFEEATFTPVNPNLPDGPQLSVLWGDPSTGPSAMLMKLTKGSIPLHTHSSEYHLVVLRGTMKHWGEGQTEAEAKELRPGSYWFQPGNQVHGDSCLTDECLMQIVWAGKRDAKLAPQEAEPAPPPQTGTSLFKTIAELDRAAFDAFNNCSSPEQLQKHASYFDKDVEFYHDNGGVTWNRQDMLANTQKYVCGNYRRELVADTLKVYPIKDFGAIAQGVHRFCQIKTGTCEGLADFVIVWRNQDNKWEITRVLSFGHRPIDAPKP